MLPPHVLLIMVKAEAFVPVIANPVRVNAAVPLFVIETLCILTLRIR